MTVHVRRDSETHETDAGSIHARWHCSFGDHHGTGHEVLPIDVPLAFGPVGVWARG